MPKEYDKIYSTFIQNVIIPFFSKSTVFCPSFFYIRNIEKIKGQNGFIEFQA